MAKYNKKRTFDNKNQNKSTTTEVSSEQKNGKKDDSITFEGVVVESLRGRFRIEINQGESKHEVLATLAGKLRRFGIKIVPGDIVNVELSPYDITRGRIVYRLKK